MRLLWSADRTPAQPEGTRNDPRSIALSLANSAARGAAATLGGQALRFAIQLASVSVLARILTPDDYGVFAMVISIVGVASILGDFGLSMAAIQKQDLTAGQRSNLFWTNLAIGVVISIAVYFAAQPIAAFYGHPELALLTQAVAVTFLINSLTPQFRAEVSSKLRFKWLAAADVSAQAVGLTTAITIALAGGGYWALAAQQIIIALVTLIVLVASAGWKPGLPRRRQQMRSLYAYGANTLGVQLVTYATSNLDNILIGRFHGAAALGVYTRAYQIFRLPLQQIAAPMTRVALPILSKLQDDPRYDAYVQRAQVILTYTFGGVFFVLAAVADPAIDVLLGPGWDGAKPIFAVLAIGGVFQALGYVYYWVFLSRAFTALQLRYSLIGRAIMIAMMVAGVPSGPIGVAIGSSAGQIVLWLLNSIFAIPKTGVVVRPLLALAVRPIILYTIMLAIALPLSWLTSDWNPLLQAITLAAFIGVYLAAAVRLIKPIRADVGLVWDAAKRIRKRKR